MVTRRAGCDKTLDSGSDEILQLDLQTKKKNPFFICKILEKVESEIPLNLNPCCAMKTIVLIIFFTRGGF